MLSDDRIPEGVVSLVTDEHCSFCSFIEGQGSEIPCKMPGFNFHENESWQPRRILLSLNFTLFEFHDGYHFWKLEYTIDKSGSRNSI